VSQSRFEQLRRSKGGLSDVDVPPLLALDHFGFERLTDAERTELVKIVREGAGARQAHTGERGGPYSARIAGLLKGSFNALQWRAFAMALVGTPAQRREAAEFFPAYYRLQLGHQAPPKGMDVLGFFHGSEPWSPGSYWGFRWAMDACVWALAVELGAHEIADLALESLWVHAAGATVLSVQARPGASYDVMRAPGKAQPFQVSPYVLAIGARGKGYTLGEPSTESADTCGIPYIYRRERMEPSATLVRGLMARARADVVMLPTFRPGEVTDDVRRVLSKVRFRGETHVLRWPGFVAAYMAKSVNGINPSNLACAVDLATGQTWHPYPFGKKGSGVAFVDKAAGLLHVQGQIPVKPIQLPTGPPISEHILDGRGLTVAAGWA
jgi:hypothetical protein